MHFFKNADFSKIGKFSEKWQIVAAQKKNLKKVKNRRNYTKSINYIILNRLVYLSHISDHSVESYTKFKFPINPSFYW